jgi:hypothetical protein
MSIFGAFNIVKETKELEAMMNKDNPKIVDFEQDSRHDKLPIHSNPKPGYVVELLYCNIFIINY